MPIAHSIWGFYYCFIDFAFLLFISNFSISIRFDSFTSEEEGRFERLGRGSRAPVLECEHWSSYTALK